MEFKKLLKAAADGDEQALGVLYRMYQPLITKMSMLNPGAPADVINGAAECESPDKMKTASEIVSGAVFLFLCMVVKYNI